MACSRIGRARTLAKFAARACVAECGHRSIACKQTQGYHFARPMTGPQLAVQLGLDPAGPLHLAVR